VEHGGSGLGTRVDTVAKGDVNSDGRVDTLVVDECEPKTTAWPQVVEVFDGASDPGGRRLLGRLLEGDQDYPRQLRWRSSPGGRVVVTGVGLSPTRRSAARPRPAQGVHVRQRALHPGREHRHPPLP
jgi:hypothetical protein